MPNDDQLANNPNWTTFQKRVDYYTHTQGGRHGGPGIVRPLHNPEYFSLPIQVNLTYGDNVHTFEIFPFFFFLISFDVHGCI